VVRLLKGMGVEVKIDKRLIRGLDYYNDICFEIKGSKGGLSLVGGGRYDRLAGLLTQGK